MSKRILYIILLCSQFSFGQTQAEFLVGNQNIFGFTLINKTFSDSSKLGFFSLTSFNGFYDNINNELVSFNRLTFSLTKRLKIAAGCSFNGLLDFYPSAGFQYTFANPTWLFVLNPGFDFNRSFTTQNFSILEFKPLLKPKLRFYARLQLLFNYNLSHQSHERSYIYIRMGLQHQKTAFGIGFDSDYYGIDLNNNINTGLFVKYNF